MLCYVIDESRFNVPFIVRGRVTRQCPQATTSEERGEPKVWRTADRVIEALRAHREMRRSTSVHAINQSISQSINQSVSQSVVADRLNRVNHSFNQSINQSICSD